MVRCRSRYRRASRFLFRWMTVSGFCSIPKFRGAFSCASTRPSSKQSTTNSNTTRRAIAYMACSQYYLNKLCEYTGFPRQSSSPAHFCWEGGWRRNVSKGRTVLVQHEVGGSNNLQHPRIFLRKGDCVINHIFVSLSHSLCSQGPTSIDVIISSIPKVSK